MLSVSNIIKLADEFQFNYQNIPSPAAREGEQEFIESYDPGKYGLTADSIVLTADSVVFTITNNVLKVLLIKRGNYPFKNFWCLPGGFVDSDDENTTKAAIRELFEETQLKIDTNINPEFVGIFDYVGRDPRMAHIISHCYALTIPEETEVYGTDDAVDALWVPVEDILLGGVPVGFDHKFLIVEATKLLKEAH